MTHVVARRVPRVGSVSQVHITSTSLSWVVLLLSCSLFGCKSDKAADPTSGVPKATLAEAQTAPSSAPVGYAFSNQDSSITFVGSNLALQQEGKFTSFSGTIAAPDADP